MLKIFSFLIIFFLIFSIFPLSLIAEGDSSNEDNGNGSPIDNGGDIPPDDESTTTDDESTTTAITIRLRNPLGVDTIGELIELIINFLTIIAFAAAPMAIVVAGYYLLTSGGDPGKVTIARNIIIWALVGILIISMANILINIVKDAIEVESEETTSSLLQKLSYYL